MSQPNPFATVTEATFEDRDYIPMARCKGKLMVVRPLEYQREGFTTKHKPDGTDVVFCDIAVLDAINSWFNEYDEEQQGFPAGHQFRNQAILQGYLKGTFKRYIGSTLIGTMYLGVPTKGKPPMMWQDLSGDPQCVTRGQGFLAACPEFLIPVPLEIAKSEPEPEPQYGFSGYQGGSAYQQPDPWAQQASQPVSAAPVSPAVPSRGPSTLDQIRGMGSTNHHGQPQSSDVPF